MTTLGFGRDNPYVLSGGPFTPEQRKQIEWNHITSIYGTSPDNKFEWVETRTFPDTGRTYDIVGSVLWIGDALAHTELWFDVTNTLAPAERGPLVTRALTTPPVKPSARALRSAGQIVGQATSQADSSSTGLIATLLILGALAGFTVLEYYSRPSPRQLSPVRRKHRKSVMLAT